MNCLCCYRPLLPGQVNYHPACAKRMFGSTEAPELPYDHSQVRQLAKSVIRTQTTVPGVQAKLSMDIQRVAHSARFTIVGLQGRFILKPQTEEYQQSSDPQRQSHEIRRECRTVISDRLDILGLRLDRLFCVV